MGAFNSSASQILLVEDNPADAHLVERALRNSIFSPDLSVVEDGMEALEFLRRRGIYESAPRPDLILLDLNIPRRDGHQVLGDLKSDPELREIPVIIFTSSSAPKEVKTSYRLGANAYVRKPIDIDEFFEVVASIENFWLGTAALPSRPIL